MARISWQEVCEAAKADNVMALKDLLRRGGSADSADQHDQTALYWAAVKGHREVVQVLLDAGATIDRASPQGMTPLMEAVFWDKVDIVELLLSSDPDMHPKDTQGKILRNLIIFISS